MSMSDKKTDLIQGTLDLLSLKTVAHEPIHQAFLAPDAFLDAGRQRPLLAQELQTQFQRCQFLAQPVVQLARDPPTFSLLRFR